MRWNFVNILSGAASVGLFGPSSKYDEVQYNIAQRAKAEGVPLDAALSRFFEERRLGQIGFTVLCMVSMGLAVLSSMMGASDVLTVCLGVTPSVSMCGIAFANHRISAMHKQCP